MRVNWLWDRKIDISQAKKILKNPKHKKFLLLAPLLLSRNNEPKEVFRNYLNPLVFCKQWAIIKKSMREDKWNDPRIIFWQAIYENLKDTYSRQGITFRKTPPSVKIPLCEKTGKQILSIRKQQGLSQQGMAKRLGVSQQLISRIEKGRENVSLYTLSKISRALGKKVDISFK